MVRELRHTIASELRPTEGRLATAWRVAVLCALTTLVFMTYGIPLAPIACYLVLFVMKPDPAESILMAIGISILVCVVVVVLFFLVRISIEEPLWRMVILATTSFLFLYIGAASQLGPAGSIVALVIGFVMTLVGDVPFGEVATRALLYAWLMALVPMALIVSFNAAFGRSAVKLLRRGLVQRLRLAAQALDETVSADNEIRAVLYEGNETLESYARFVRLFHLVPTAESRALTAGVMRSYAILLTILAVSEAGNADSRVTQESSHRKLSQQCRSLANTIEAGELWQYKLSADTPDDCNRVLDDHLRNFTVPVPGDPDAKKEGFFYADALTNPVYQHFALKTTGAAILCYLIYTALDWQDIHTAMVTCYVAALGTTGETLHKLTLRIIGCLVGAAMGILSIIFLIPHMTSIGELMVLVFIGILAAAWVSSGSERISYAGVQIGLAFLLTTLQGFGPDVQVSVATDRVIGILLGNTVLFLVFTRVWPVSAIETVQRKLSEVLDTLQGAAEKQGILRPSLHPGVAEHLLVTLASTKEELRFLHFEPQFLRPSMTRRTRLRLLIAQLESLSLTMVVSETVSPASEITSSEILSAHPGMERLETQMKQMRQELVTTLA